MDIGATVCRPRSPRCEACPLEAWCRFAIARDAAGAAARPVARPKARRAVAGSRAPAGSLAAARSRAAAGSRAPAIPFSATTRWLRGRIVDRLRSASGAAWSTVDAPIGDHDAAAVRAALAALARDGVIERHETDPDRARLAIR
jgi:A/G-specific adenine glycosylase